MNAFLMKRLTELKAGSVSAEEYSLLFTIAVYSQNGLCRASVERLAMHSGLCTDTVSALKRSLEKKGYIESVQYDAPGFSKRMGIQIKIPD